MAAKKTKKVIKFGKFKWVAASAIFAVIAGMCFIAPPTDNQEVFENNFMAYEDDITQELDMMLATRGAGDENDEARKELQKMRDAMAHYNNKEYVAAIPMFKTYLKENPDAHDVQDIKFYLAVSFLGNKQTTDSKPILEELVQSTNQELKEDAQWYLSLTYARMEQPDAARELLKELTSSEKYGAKADKILNPAKQNVVFK